MPNVLNNNTRITSYVVFIDTERLSYCMNEVVHEEIVNRKEQLSCTYPSIQQNSIQFARGR